MSDPIPGRSKDRTPSQAELNAERVRIDNVIADVMKAVPKAPAKTHEEEMIEHVTAITKEVFKSFMLQYQINVNPMTKQQAANHIIDLYKAKYSSWPKDDLVEVLSMTLASLAVESIRHKLI